MNAASRLGACALFAGLACAPPTGLAADPVDQGHYRPKAAMPERASAANHAIEDKPYFQRWREGWFWYQDPARAPQRDDKHLPPPPSSRSESAAEQLARIQKDLEEAQAKAVLDPTESNVRAWLTYNNWMQSSAARFGEVAQQVLWQSPALDNTVAQPVNHLALAQYRAEKTATRTDAVRALGTTHALVFFLKGACPYCHTFAPILREFAARAGISVYPVSLDGGGLPEYPEPRVDPASAARFGVDVVPAVFLVEPRTGKHTPVAFGVVSAEDLAIRLETIAREAPNPESDTLRTVQIDTSP